MPLSPTALRAALIRLVSVDSETMRPSQIVLDQIVLGDDAVAVLDQIDQQIEHLRLDRDALAAAGQLAEVDIKHMVGKVKLHGCHPGAASASDGSLRRRMRTGRRIYRRTFVRCLTDSDISPKNQDAPQGKISPPSESLGPRRAMFGSSRPHSVAA